MKIDELADVFLDLANFAPHALSTLAPPSSYALNSNFRSVSGFRTIGGQESKFSPVFLIDLSYKLPNSFNWLISTKSIAKNEVNLQPSIF